MIWSLLGKSFYKGFIALALFFGIIVRERSSARKDAIQDAKEKDRNNADDIRDRVRNVSDSVHEFDGRGFRD